MSQIATVWAMGRDLPPVAKLVLWVLADNAGEDGQATWATPDMMSTVVSQTTPATMKKHVGTLLAEGYIREGDQMRISPSWLSERRDFRPIVYDLAMNEETRLQWKAAYDPAAGLHGAAVARGSQAGKASAAARAAARQAAGAAPAAAAADDSARCQEIQHQPDPGYQEIQHREPAEPDTGPVSENSPAGVEKTNTLQRTKDLLTTTDPKDGGGEEPPAPRHLGSARQVPGGLPAGTPVHGALVDEVTARRPSWSRAAVTAALSDPAVTAADPARVRLVILELASDPETVYPSRLRHMLRPGRRPAPETAAVPAPGLAHPLPAGWQPSAELLSWAAKEVPAVDAAAATTGFLVHFQASGAARHGWDGEWKKWLVRESRFQTERGGAEQAPAGLRPAQEPPWQPARSTPAPPPAAAGLAAPPGYRPGTVSPAADQHLARIKAELAQRHGAVFTNSHGPLAPGPSATATAQP